jgi:hypothetical protein
MREKLLGCIGLDGGDSAEEVDQAGSLQAQAKKKWRSPGAANAG